MRKTREEETASNASHRPPQTPQELWHQPQTVLLMHREPPLHPAEGKTMPVGATRKHLEHLAFGILGAGAGLAWLRCSCNTERGTNVGTSVRPVTSPPPHAANMENHVDGRRRAGMPMPGHPTSLEGHFRPIRSLCGGWGCSACPRPGR